jgi:hypothetical protein
VAVAVVVLAMKVVGAALAVYYLDLLLCPKDVQLLLELAQAAPALLAEQTQAHMYPAHLVMSVILIVRQQAML